MRKLIKIAVALGLVLCLATVAFAAPNPGGSFTSNTNITGATGKDGTPAQVTESAPTVTLTADQAVEVLKDVAPAGTKAEDLSVVYSMDLSVPAEVLPVSITFEVKGAKADDNIYVLHYNGSAWEVVANGKGATITAVFTSLSPVAVVLQPAEKTANPPAGGDGPTSPQTSAEMLTLYVGVAVVLIAGAVALAAKKKKDA